MIRDALPADAEAIVTLVHHARLRAYAELMAPDELEREAAERNVARYRSHVEVPERPGRMLVDVEGDLLAGMAAVGREAHGDSGPGTGELHALYVEPVAQGAGVGGRLLRAAEDALRELGYADAVLWVYEGNGHARHVYAGAGWVEEPREAWAHLHGSDWGAAALRLRKAL